MSTKDTYIVISKFFLILLFITGTLFFVSSFRDSGYFDGYYKKITTPKSKSLILGISGAAQGIRPSVFHERLKKSKFNLPISNYAFTLVHSAFGKIYLESVQKKIDTIDNKNGLFILEVNPWSISNDNKNFDTYIEDVSFIGGLDNVSSSPNYTYLMHYYEKPYYELLMKKPVFVHEDGWVEVSVPMDAVNVQKRIDSKVKEYEKNAQNYTYSLNRYNYLVETIRYLKKYGTVLLVRLPKSSEIKNIEEQYMPIFDNMIQKLSTEESLEYLNLMQDSTTIYPTTDGNHLSKDAGITATNKICDFITTKIGNEKK